MLQLSPVLLLARLPSQALGLLHVDLLPPLVIFATEVGEVVSTGSDYGMIERGGIIGALFLGVVGFMREWWVPGSQYRRSEAERVRLQGELEKALPLLSRATEVMAHKVPVSGRDG